MSAPAGGHQPVTGHLVALALFCTATLAFFAPDLPHLSTSVGRSAGDAVFNLYVLKWGSYQISRGLDDFWGAPFFHPTPDALSLSDHLLGPAAAFHVLRRAGDTAGRVQRARSDHVRSRGLGGVVGTQALRGVVDGGRGGRVGLHLLDIPLALAGLSLNGE